MDKFQLCLLGLRKEPWKRTELDVALIAGYCNKFEFFQQFKDEESQGNDPYGMKGISSLATWKKEIFRSLGVREMDANQLVCRQGEVGSTFYIVLSGSVSVHRNAAIDSTGGLSDDVYLKVLNDSKWSSYQGSAIEKVDENMMNSSIMASINTGTTFEDQYGPVIANLSEGDAFGEAALLKSIHRTATIVTTEPTILLCLEQKDFLKLRQAGLGENVTPIWRPSQIRSILLKNPQNRDDHDSGVLTSVMRNVRFFKQLENPIIRQLCSKMVFSEALAETVLFTQGQATNSFIVVLSGTLSVHLRGLEMNRHVQIDTEMKDHAITRHGSGVSKLMLHSLSLQDTNTKVEDIEARISKLEQQYGPSVCILSNGDGYGWTEGDAAFATVVTISDCEFIRLEESDFRDALRNVGDTKSWNYRDFFASQADVQVMLKSSAERTPNDLNHLVKLLSNVPFLQQLPMNLQRKVCQVMEVRTASVGDVVFLEGELGNTFCVIWKGSVSIHKRDSMKNEASRSLAFQKLEEEFGPCVGTLYAGDSFGELAFLEDGLRTASVLARQACTLLTLTKAQYLSILSQSQNAETYVPNKTRQCLQKPPSHRKLEDINSILDWCKNLAYMRSFPDSYLRSIARIATHERYPGKTPIYVNGQEDHCFYIILRGSVSLHTHSADQGIFSTPNFSLPNTPTSTLEKFSSTPQKTLHHSRNNSVFPVDVLQDAHEELYRKVTDLLGNKRVNNSTDFSIPDSLGSLVGPCRLVLLQGDGFGTIWWPFSTKRDATIITRESTELFKVDYKELKAFYLDRFSSFIQPYALSRIERAALNEENRSDDNADIILPLLRRLPLFRNLDDSSLWHLSKRVSLRQIKSNSPVLSKESDESAIILSGIVEIFEENASTLNDSTGLSCQRSGFTSIAEELGLSFFVGYGAGSPDLGSSDQYVIAEEDNTQLSGSNLLKLAHSHTDKVFGVEGTHNTRSNSMKSNKSLSNKRLAKSDSSSSVASHDEESSVSQFMPISREADSIRDCNYERCFGVLIGGDAIGKLAELWNRKCGEEYDSFDMGEHDSEQSSVMDSQKLKAHDVSFSVTLRVANSLSEFTQDFEQYITTAPPDNRSLEKSSQVPLPRQSKTNSTLGISETSTLVRSSVGKNARDKLTLSINPQIDNALPNCELLVISHADWRNALNLSKQSLIRSSFNPTNNSTQRVGWGRVRRLVDVRKVLQGMFRDVHDQADIMAHKDSWDLSKEAESQQSETKKPAGKSKWGALKQRMASPQTDQKPVESSGERIWNRMRVNMIADMLKSTPTFQQLPSSILQKLAKAAHIDIWSAGAVILSQDMGLNRENPGEIGNADKLNVEKRQEDIRNMPRSSFGEVDENLKEHVKAKSKINSNGSFLCCIVTGVVTVHKLPRYKIQAFSDLDVSAGNTLAKLESGNVFGQFECLEDCAFQHAFAIRSPSQVILIEAGVVRELVMQFPRDFSRLTAKYSILQEATIVSSLSLQDRATLHMVGNLVSVPRKTCIMRWNLSQSNSVSMQQAHITPLLKHVCSSMQYRVYAENSGKRESEESKRNESDNSTHREQESKETRLNEGHHMEKSSSIETFVNLDVNRVSEESGSASTTSNPQSPNTLPFCILVKGQCSDILVPKSIHQAKRARLGRSLKSLHSKSAISLDVVDDVIATCGNDVFTLIGPNEKQEIPAPAKPLHVATIAPYSVFGPHWALGLNFATVPQDNRSAVESVDTSLHRYNSSNLHPSNASSIPILKDPQLILDKQNPSETEEKARAVRYFISEEQIVASCEALLFVVNAQDIKFHLSRASVVALNDSLSTREEWKNCRAVELMIQQAKEREISGQRDLLLHFGVSIEETDRIMSKLTQSTAISDTPRKIIEPWPNHLDGVRPHGPLKGVHSASFPLLGSSGLLKENQCVPKSLFSNNIHVNQDSNLTSPPWSKQWDNKKQRRASTRLTQMARLPSAISIFDFSEEFDPSARVDKITQSIFGKKLNSEVSLADLTYATQIRNRINSKNDTQIAQTGSLDVPNASALSTVLKPKPSYSETYVSAETAVLETSRGLKDKLLAPNPPKRIVAQHSVQQTPRSRHFRSSGYPTATDKSKYTSTLSAEYSVVNRISKLVLEELKNGEANDVFHQMQENTTIARLPRTKSDASSHMVQEDPWKAIQVEIRDSELPTTQNDLQSQFAKPLPNAVESSPGVSLSNSQVIQRSKKMVKLRSKMHEESTQRALRLIGSKKRKNWIHIQSTEKSKHSERRIEAHETSKGVIVCEEVGNYDRWQGFVT